MSVENVLKKKFPFDTNSWLHSSRTVRKIATISHDVTSDYNHRKWLITLAPPSPPWYTSVRALGARVALSCCALEKNTTNWKPTLSRSTRPFSDEPADILSWFSERIPGRDRFPRRSAAAKLRRIATVTVYDNFIFYVVFLIIISDREDAAAPNAFFLVGSASTASVFHVSRSDRFPLLPLLHPHKKAVWTRRRHQWSDGAQPNDDDDDDATKRTLSSSTIRLQYHNW